MKGLLSMQVLPGRSHAARKAIADSTDPGLEPLENWSMDGRRIYCDDASR